MNDIINEKNQYEQTLHNFSFVGKREIRQNFLKVIQKMINFHILFVSITTKYHKIPCM